MRPTEKKLSKDEKKAEAAKKKAERDARKAAQKAIDDKIAGREPAAEEGEGDAQDNKAEAKAKKAKDKKDGSESTEASGALQKVNDGTARHAVCTSVLVSRKDSKDVKIGSFSISLFGKLLFEDQTLELTWGHRCACPPPKPARTLHRAACTAAACRECGLPRLCAASGMLTRVGVGARTQMASSRKTGRARAPSSR
jgi:hypothetical protein